jgi:hypothetical protein
MLGRLPDKRSPPLTTESKDTEANGLGRANSLFLSFASKECKRHWPADSYLNQSSEKGLPGFGDFITRPQKFFFKEVVVLSVRASAALFIKHKNSNIGAGCALNQENFLFYINFENFGDVRQTRFESIYTGTTTNPMFKDICTPGRIRM